jgi:hypothetical protein
LLAKIAEREHGGRAKRKYGKAQTDSMKKQRDEMVFSAGGEAATPRRELIEFSYQLIYEGAGRFQPCAGEKHSGKVRAGIPAPKFKPLLSYNGQYCEEFTKLYETSQQLTYFISLILLYLPRRIKKKKTIVLLPPLKNK